MSKVTTSLTISNLPKFAGKVTRQHLLFLALFIDTFWIRW